MLPTVSRTIYLLFRILGGTPLKHIGAALEACQYHPGGERCKCEKTVKALQCSKVLRIFGSKALEDAGKPVELLKAILRLRRAAHIVRMFESFIHCESFKTCYQQCLEPVTCCLESSEAKHASALERPAALVLELVIIILRLRGARTTLSSSFWLRRQSLYMF